MQQGSDEWFAARLGKVTASRVADVVAKTKSGPAASRKNYLAQLVAERLTKTASDSFTNAAMQWGTEKEPEARSAYTLMTDNPVEGVGFVDHPTIAMTGASPDGLVADNGLVEIKCPNTATHIETLLSGNVPSKHNTQMQWQMACTGREWCDFVSYDPRLTGDLALFVERVERDYTLISELESSVSDFLDDVEETITKLMAL